MELASTLLFQMEELASTLNSIKKKKVALFQPSAVMIQTSRIALIDSDIDTYETVRCLAFLVISSETEVGADTHDVRESYGWLEHASG